MSWSKLSTEVQERLDKGLCRKCGERPVGITKYERRPSQYCDICRPVRSRTQAAAYLSDDVERREYIDRDFTARDDYLRQDRATLELFLTHSSLNIREIKDGLRAMGIEPSGCYLMLSLENTAIESYQAGAMQRYRLRTEFVKEIRQPETKGRVNISIEPRQTSLFRVGGV